MTIIGTLVTPSDHERFWSKVDKSGNCWEWAGARDENGYGFFWLSGRPRKTHRVAYQTLRGAVPDGMNLDHLCRNPPCLNPDHLEVVTSSENQRRGLNGFGARDMCKQGLHDISDPVSWYVDPAGHRTCHQCVRDRTGRKDNCPWCGKYLTVLHIHSPKHNCKGKKALECE